MHRRKTSESLFRRAASGQALVEYVLIFVLVVVAFAVALAATGPAIGNVFSNTIYNLLGQTTTPRALGNAEDFWMTVTWVATQTPQEFPLPTNTDAPPSKTPTPGPSPTPSPTVPTATFTSTWTPGPTNTPSDFLFTAPFEDRIDNPEWWRVDKSVFLGSDPWKGQYYSNRSLSGSPTQEKDTKQIDFDWGNGPPVAGWSVTDNFSVKWTRKIYLPKQTKLHFDTVSNNGLRIWLLKEGQTAGSCSSTGTPSGGNGPNGGTPKIYGDPSTDCLLLDKWYHGTEDTIAFDRTIPEGQYTLQVDFYEETSSAKVTVNITNASAPTNVDDASTSGGSVDCNWGNHPISRNTNTLDLMWEEYVNGDFPKYMRCYLEFRGRVFVPPGMTNPEFTFWDIWDFRGSDLSGWLELAVYDPILGDITNRTPGTGAWKRIDLHLGDTTNYNWTRHSIDLTNVGGIDFRGKEVTWRFVMENVNAGNIRRWYIDDINITNKTYKTYFPGQFWTLDTDDQKNDFIASGRWGLTSQNTHGSGMSWEDSPNAYYDKHSEWTNLNTRIHSLEFNGWVDLADVAGAKDLEGDEGIPMLSFWHAFAIHRKTTAEVQYTTDDFGVNAPNWQVVPSDDPGAPYGRIVSYDASNWQGQDMNFIEVPLDKIPATKFRLRFALIVPYDASTSEGWYIDDIYLERKGKPKFTDYPFFDDAESGKGKWIMTGKWDRTTEAAFGESEHSFTDSPNGNYDRSTSTSMLIRFPFDFNNDTPTNPKSTTCTLGADCTFDGTKATRPYMTFWHRRHINSNSDAFYVEWRRWNDDDTPANWNQLWGFKYGMNTQSSSTSSRGSTQVTWERVVIDLMPIIEAFDPNPANQEDDDILIRIRLETDSNWNLGDGVYIDDISIGEYSEKSVKLWSTSVDTGFGVGTGTSWQDDVDTPFDWWNRWWLGGGWEVIDWEQSNGLKSFHASPRNGTVVQTAAPQDVNDTYVPTLHDTYNVLEMQQIIDLRSVDVSVGPTLYFWNRYWTGRNDRLRVEVSVEDTSLTAPCATPGLAQCYDHVRGWAEWQTLWQVDQWQITFAWRREQIALDNFAGKRIKLRFVSDALDSDDNRDGWYIDNITFKYRNPPKLYTLPFTDAARNMSRWLGEGDWGLSPDLFRGAGGGPASLGASWRGYWWDCSNCENLAPGGTNSADKFRFGADQFLKSKPGFPQTPGEETALGANAKETVLDINHDVDYNNLFCDTAPPNTCRKDKVVGRWELETPAVGAGGIQPGDYNLITISDDGVRLKYTSVPTGGVPPSPLGEWNLINNWTDHGRTVDMGTAKLAAGYKYRFTLEYYEKGSRAVIILTLGSNSFSFTDTPKQGAGPSFPDVPPIKRGNYSLILDGLLDLSTATAPVMEYYSYYEIEGPAWVEISTDGGFCWGGQCFGSDNTYRNTLTNGGYDDPRIMWSTWMPDNGEWRRRQHNLAAFAGDQVGLRFRMDMTSRDNIDRTTGNGRYIGWWIVDIRILDP